MTCAVQECTEPVCVKKMCSMHYQRARKGNLRAGDPSKRRPWQDRFDSRVNKNGPIPKWRPDLGPCWEWTGNPSRRGDGGKDYGHAQLRVDGRLQFVHRLAYERWVGEIPDEHQVDHLCRNGACVRPTHLEPVPGSVNSQRARECPRCLFLTHCPGCGDELPT